MATLKVTDRVGELGNLAGDLGGYLKEQREHARLSLRQLASATGISNPYLSQIERGLRKPSAEVLQQIAKGLQISAEALFLRAGILEESPGLQVEVAIQSDVYLTARQKRVLLDIYTTFRAENLRGSAGDAAVGAAAAVDALDNADTADTADAGSPAVRKAVAGKRTRKKAPAQGSGAASTSPSTSASTSPSDSTSDSTAVPRRTRARRRTTQGDNNG